MSRRFTSLLAVAVGAIGLVASAHGAGPPSSGVAEPSAADARRGGTVVFAQDQEPRTLNGWVTEGNLFTTTEVLASLFDSGMRYDPSARLVPLLVAGQPRVVGRNPLTVRFAYKRAARWYDGTPVTAADFRFTWQTVTDARWNITLRAGWEDIGAVRGAGRSVTVIFEKPYAGWKSLVASAVLPEHALRGENFNQVWRSDVNNPKTGRPVANGPYLLESWHRGRQLRVVRNPRYYGRKAYLAAIVYRFVPNTATQFQALRAGEVDVMRPQFQFQIDEIKRDRRFRVQQGPEYVWEHIDFQQGPQGHPALKRRYVRHAIAAAISRRQIANTLFRPIVSSLPVLNSVVYQQHEPEYRPRWAIHRFDQRRAIAILRANGCTGGPARPHASNRDVYSCPGVGELSFRYTTNLGAAARRPLMFQILQAQLLAVGIRVNPDSIPGLQPRLGTGNWDIFNFAWVGSPTSWLTLVNVYGCGRAQNFMNYCDREVTRLLTRAATTTDEARRRRSLARADALLARDVPTLPIYAAPGFAIHRRNVRSVVRNPTAASLFWNAGSWWIA
jgi:peptide/nickel transport system substrate-binding protein